MHVPPKGFPDNLGTNFTVYRLTPYTSQSGLHDGCAWAQLKTAPGKTNQTSDGAKSYFNSFPTVPLRACNNVCTQIQGKSLNMASTSCPAKLTFCLQQCNVQYIHVLKNQSLIRSLLGIDSKIFKAGNNLVVWSRQPCAASPVILHINSRVRIRGAIFPKSHRQTHPISSCAMVKCLSRAITSPNFKSYGMKGMIPSSHLIY